MSFRPCVGIKLLIPKRDARFFRLWKVCPIDKNSNQIKTTPDGCLRCVRRGKLCLVCGSYFSKRAIRGNQTKRIKSRARQQSRSVSFFPRHGQSVMMTKKILCLNQKCFCCFLSFYLQFLARKNWFGCSSLRSSKINSEFTKHNNTTQDKKCNRQRKKSKKNARRKGKAREDHLCQWRHIAEIFNTAYLTDVIVKNSRFELVCPTNPNLSYSDKCLPMRYTRLPFAR